MALFWASTAWSLGLPPNVDAFAARQTGVDFTEVARNYPRFKTLVLVSFSKRLDLTDVYKLKSLDAFPQSGGNLGLLGKHWAVMFTRAGSLKRLMKSPLTEKVVPLTRFTLRGIYEVAFKLVDEEYEGPLEFRTSMPRSDFGKELKALHVLVSPKREYRVRPGTAGNKWLYYNLDQAEKGSEVKFGFDFTYEVDLAEFLAHALAMVPVSEEILLPIEGRASEFLLPSPKITSDSEQVVDLAHEIMGNSRAPREMYRRVLAYIKRNLPYDRGKRSLFFGGKMVYWDMAEMYNIPAVTLTQGRAACPSTSVLETALLRAAGIPARTAGRWGHFYTELFMPGRGWLSTSITPTGIPLVVDYDNHHQPFAGWTPAVRVQTTRWSGQVKVLIDSDYDQ